ncbi:MAG: hypothetical protein IPP69_02875 [Flavobacteriales bacterium]|nr:hypothetical protein [Flavobacteriales bacterium]
MKTQNYPKILLLAVLVVYSCRNHDQHSQSMLELKSLNDSTFTSVYVNFQSLMDTFLFDHGKSYRFKKFEFVNSDTIDYYLSCADFDILLYGFYSAIDSNGVERVAFSDYFSNFKLLKADSTATVLISDTEKFKILRPVIALYTDTLSLKKRPLKPTFVFRRD